MPISRTNKDKRLDRVEKLLYGWNYQVWLGLYGPVGPDRGLQESSQDLVSDSAVVSGIAATTSQCARDEIMRSVLYEGEADHGPKDLASKRSEVTVLIEEVLSQINLSRADMICRFEFANGHPAYPVFWDFAFDIHSDGKRWILVGSSSD